MAKTPRTDDLLPSHPGEPYAYGASPRVEEKDIQGSVDKSMFKTGLTPIEIVSVLPTLPDTKYPQGSVVFLTTDNKLYRCTGSAWTLAVPTVDLTGTITTAQIGDAQVTTVKIGDAQVTTTKMVDGSVTTAKIGDLQVSTAKLVDLSVVTAKLAALAVDTSKLADLAVTTAKLVDGSVLTAKLADLNVTLAKLAANSVDSGKLVDGSVLTAKLADLNVTLAKLAANSVDTSKIIDGSVLTAKLADLNVTLAKLGANSVDLSKLFVGSFDNLLLNGNFEQSTSGFAPWSSTGYTNNGGTFSLANASGIARSAPNALQFDPAGQAASFTDFGPYPFGASGIKQMPTASAGDQHYFEYWVRKIGTGAAQDVQAAIRYIGADGSNLGGINGAAVTPTQVYQKVSVTGSGAPANTAYVSVFIRCTSPAGATELLLFDDAYARRMTTGSIIVDGAITTAKLVAGAVTANEIAALTITAAQIAAATITGAKIAAGTITASNILAGTITANEIAALTITAAQIAASTITGAKIAAGTITATNIAADTITANEIAASAITSSELAANAVIAGKIAAGTIVANDIAAATITGAKIAAVTIAASNIIAGTITANEIAANTITAAKIAAGTITANEIAAATITGAKIAAATITGSLIAADTITTTRLVAGFRNFLLQTDPLNGLKNPGFEDGSAFWALPSGCTVVTDSTKAHSGNQYLQISGAAGVYTGSTQSDDSGGNSYFEIEEGDVIYFGGWGYRESGDASCRYVIAAYDKDKANANFTVSSAFTTGAWSKRTATYTAPAGKKYVICYAENANDGTITTVCRYDDAFLTVMVPGASIVANSITAAQIAAGTITATEIAAGAITTVKLAAGSVTSNELAANAVVAGKIAAGTIVAADIAAATITGAKIAAATIAASNIVASTITANEIAAGTITAAKLAATMILTNLLQVDDTQGSPVTRVKLGKVAGGTTDYGIQVFDSAGGTIMDFTGAKRILAVPIQASTDSGSSLTIDLSTGLTRQVRLTANSPTITLTNPTDGGRYRIWFQQDTTGSRTFPIIVGANGEIVMFTNDTAPTLTTTPGALDLFEFEYRITPTSRYSCMPLQTNVLLPAPIVSTAQGTDNLATAINTIGMPASIVAGNLLVMVVTRSGGTITSEPSGWTRLAGTLGTNIVVYAKVAAGGDTASITIDSAVDLAASTLNIKRWLGSLSGVAVSSFGAGISTAPDPPSLTAGWTDRSLWLAAVVAPSADPGTITNPANYVAAGSAGTAATQVKIVQRNLYATTENPGAFTAGNSISWSTVTISVQPPA